MSRDQPHTFEPIEDLGHTPARPEQDLGELGGRHAVRRSDQLEDTQHGVVDEEEPEPVETAVLEFVDEEAHAGEASEQADRARLRQVSRLVVHDYRATGPSIVARCMIRRSS